MKNMERLPENWLYLSHDPGKSLTDAFQQLHHAVQFIAMADQYLYSGGTGQVMAWNPERHSFIGREISAPEPFRVALHTTQMNLEVLDNELKVLSHLHLPGVTQGYVFAWLKEQVAERGADFTLLKRKLNYTIPEHGIDRCAPFRITEPEVYREAAKYRTNAENTARYFSDSFLQSSDVVVAADKFTTSFVSSLATDNNGNMTKSIEVGWTPYGINGSSPCFFVQPWSSVIPIHDTLPGVAVGQWSKVPWPAAILTTEKLILAEDNIQQANLVLDFFKSAINSSLQILDLVEIRYN
jgi:hypothetical protein